MDGIANLFANKSLRIITTQTYPREKFQESVCNNMKITANIDYDRIDGNVDTMDLEFFL